MADFSINEMIIMQKELQEAYQGALNNENISFENVRSKFLWMIGEVGEAVELLKKNEIDMLFSDTKLRATFIEELSDVLMYYIDILLCLDISADELKNIYTKKKIKN